MLEFLVTSKARRRLLRLLWGDEASGSASALARRAGVGFASAYRELQAMRRLALVDVARRDGATVFSANRRHPLAGALEDLLASPRQARRSLEATRARAAALGAPVLAARAAKRNGSVEQMLVEAVTRAHEDPALARALPVAFYRQRDRVNPERLALAAQAGAEKAAVGLFLELTAQVSGDRRFSEWARPLRDRRVRVKRPFFYSTAAAVQAATVPDRSPPVARRWGFRLDYSLDDFRSLFEKVRRAAA